MTGQNRERIVEAYIGEYASGKSEIAINRALELHSQGRQVSLVVSPIHHRSQQS